MWLLGGACMVALGEGHAWLLRGGHAWLLLGGACVVTPGGACMVAPGGGHVWLLQGGHAWLLPVRGVSGCSWGGACTGYDEIRRYDQ